ncbi:MAG: hypothetical protein HQK53_11115 [Oligoflexia bacterium]|nr:hypothetical protein [Oligoflexia bacterium]
MNRSSVTSYFFLFVFIYISSFLNNFESSSAAAAAGAGDEVTNLKQGIAEVENRIQEQILSHQGVGTNRRVVVLGQTGNGKSTLINFLAGRNLTMEEIEGEGVARRNLVVDNPLPGFAFSHDINVGTRLPAAWFYQSPGDGVNVDVSNNAVFWDCPGFGDTRGSIDQISNAFAINKILKYPSSDGLPLQIKIVLVISEELITERAEIFLGLLDRLTKLIPDYQQLQRSLVLVFSKHRQENDVRQQVIEISAQVSAGAGEAAVGEGGQRVAVTPQTTALLRYIAAHANERIALFPMPEEVELEQPGPFRHDDIREEILQKIAAASYMAEPESRISIEPEARELARNFANSINADITNMLRDNATNEIIEHFKTVIGQHHTTITPLREGFSRDSSRLRPSHLHLNPGRLFATLNELLDSFIPNEQVKSRVRKTIGLLTFLRSLNIDVNYATENWMQTFNVVAAKATGLSRAPTVEVVAEDGLLKISGYLVSMGDVVSAVRLHPEISMSPTFRRIEVAAFNTFIFDMDASFPGVSLSMKQ